jgi:putative endonuclease
MPANNRHLGQQSEKAAVGHLRRLGYKIIDRNFRTRFGEIDIIAEHEGVVVFVEVKARRSMRYGSPKLAVTARKQRKISMVALAYLKRFRSLDTRARFDVVSIRHGSGAPEIELITNAFDLAYA